MQGWKWKVKGQKRGSRKVENTETEQESLELRAAMKELLNELG